jgi:prepilin-type N-terminal cleavage/methylation domain-containing protein
MRNYKGQRSRGLSLIEVLIVMAVVSIGMLGAMSVFYWGLRAGTEGAQMTEAINYSRDLLEAIRVRNLAFGTGAAITTDPDLLGSHPLDFAPFTDLNLPPPEKTVFHREISISRLGTGYEARIARINVATVWDIKGRTKRVEIEGYASVQ